MESGERARALVAPFTQPPSVADASDMPRNPRRSIFISSSFSARLRFEVSAR
jgi:hypothetical protein